MESGEAAEGRLDMLVLRFLVTGPAHGHAIARALEGGPGGVLQGEHGPLYPALHRLETRGWIASAWVIAGGNRRARYYRLTSAGRKQLIVPFTGREQAPLVRACVGASIALALSSRPSAQITDGRPALEVTTEDRSSGGVELATARGRVNAIFTNAGIHVVWRARAAVALAEDRTQRIQLVVLSGSDADELFRDRAHLLGIAIPSASRVYVHYDRVQALARYYRTPPGWFLGVVIAHEVAHVLLPHAGHTDSGLMGARLSPETTTMFTAQQAQSLRARLHDGVTVAGLDAR